MQSNTEREGCDPCGAHAPSLTKRSGPKLREVGRWLAEWAIYSAAGVAIAVTGHLMGWF